MESQRILNVRIRSAFVSLLGQIVKMTLPSAKELKDSKHATDYHIISTTLSSIVAFC